MRSALCLLVATVVACKGDPQRLDAGVDDATSALDGTTNEDVATNDRAVPNNVGDRDADPPRDDGAATDTRDAPDMPSLPTPNACAELPIAGATIDVAAADASSLPDIVAGAPAGTTILLADGTYVLDGGDAASRLQINTNGITLRGASGDASAVVLDGNYQTNELVTIHANDVTVAHLTITRAVDHLVHVTPSGAPVTGTRLHDVRFRDSGEQFVKINSDGSDTNYTDSGEVSCSLFELTDAGRANVERNPGGCYTGGIDAHSAAGWHVHHNRFVDIYCAGEGLAEHAVHFWSDSRDTIVEQNTILNCARGIGFGLGNTGTERDYPDDPYPGVSYVGHVDGIIRNNVIWADHDYYDTGIELQQARGASVVHNTVVSPVGIGGFFSSIDYRFANTQVEIYNNITRRITMRDGANGDLAANLQDADLNLFSDIGARDFHLVPAAAAAIDQGQSTAEAGLDIDGQPHDNGSPDIGADEFVP